MNHRPLTFLLFALAALAGCGAPHEPWGSVEGQILFDNKPVDHATVLFSSDTLGVHLSAPTDAEGKFEIRSANVAGVPVGEYRVAVTPLPPSVPEPTDTIVFTQRPPEFHSPVPPRYHNPKSTDLTANVQEGENSFTFTLEPKLGSQ